MEIYKSPEKYPADNKFTVFLGGSIEMDKAEKWQEKLTQTLSPFDIRVLNPRRDSFDVSQKQSIDNPYFKEQVTWELDGLERSDLIVMYLQPDTLSPISMMEIGIYINTLDWNKQMIICCPEGFWRKGNIEILVDRYPYHCTLLGTYDELEKYIIDKCNSFKNEN
jgi:hypothetical protein